MGSGLKARESAPQQEAWPVPPSGETVKSLTIELGEVFIRELTSSKLKMQCLVFGRVASWPARGLLARVRVLRHVFGRPGALQPAQGPACAKASGASASVCGSPRDSAPSSSSSTGALRGPRGPLRRGVHLLLCPWLGFVFHSPHCDVSQ